MDMNLSRLREIAEDMEIWHAAVHGVTKSTWLSEWTTNSFFVLNERFVEFCSVLQFSKVLRRWFHNPIIIPFSHPTPLLSFSSSPPSPHWQPLVCSLCLWAHLCFVIFPRLLCFFRLHIKVVYSVCLSLWIISFSTMPSKFVHIAVNGKILFFLWLSNILLFITSSSLSIRLLMNT